MVIKILKSSIKYLKDSTTDKNQTTDSQYETELNKFYIIPFQ